MEGSRLLKTLTTLLLCCASLNGQNYPDFFDCILEGGIEHGSVVARSDSAVYNILNFQWQLKPPQISPFAYILPKDEDDVVRTVTCGRKNMVRLVARSGGHSFEKYSFGDNDSIVIDLSNLNSIVVDNAKSVAVIGAGALVGPIVMTLWNEAKACFPVSSCPTVGISGLATGGGHGFLARPYGLTSDYILGVRIVTADGQPIDVNNDSNKDLYWALRGGGAASFGIVVSFIMKIIPAPPVVFIASPSWNLAHFPGVFTAWQQFTVRGPRSVTAKMDINSGNIGIFFSDAAGTAENFDAIISNFPPVTTITRQLQTYPDFFMSTAGKLKLEDGTALDFPEAMLRVQRNSVVPEYQVEKSFYVEKIATEKDMRNLHEFLAEIPPSVTISFHTYGGAINDVKPNETAFVHREGRLALGIGGNHVTPGNETQLEGNIWVDRFFELGKTIFGQKESYQNYVDAELQSDYLQRYYGSNFVQLVEVKNKYDPDNYFSNPQSIPTKLDSH